MNPEDRLRRLRDDDRWIDEPFELRAAPPKQPRSLAPLRWASVGVGIAALLVGLFVVGKQVHFSSSSGSAAGTTTSGKSQQYSASSGTGASPVVPWTDSPAAGGAGNAAAAPQAGGTVSGLRATIALPTTISADSTLDYRVTLRNTGDGAVTWATCPVYVESLTTEAASTPATAYRLNCTSTGSLRPGAAVVFDMRIAVPADATGTLTLTWRLGAAAATATGKVIP
jgi:hypothetical protein